MKHGTESSRGAWSMLMGSRVLSQMANWDDRLGEQSWHLRSTAADCNTTVALNIRCAAESSVLRKYNSQKPLEMSAHHNKVLLSQSQRERTLCYMFFKWHILNLWPCESDGSHLGSGSFSWWGRWLMQYYGSGTSLAIVYSSSEVCGSKKKKKKKMQVACSAVSVLSVSLSLPLPSDVYVGVRTTVHVSR